MKEREERGMKEGWKRGGGRGGTDERVQTGSAQKARLVLGTN